MEDIYEIYLLRATYEQVAVRTYEGQLSDEDLGTDGIHRGRDEDFW